ncbi:HNH endonuclease [Herbaspirillum rubrisubalbicans]|uniref:HNH endonuclease n=1 Tax=Herbaspirillum rubrisubalbicans TaxID=80842 RepID=A0AAD0U334_9BURK|nr:HNH endonuclease [Herbaspirillum rubrisubalbicans]
MPNRVADKFRQEKAKFPQSTEAERLIIQRVGQDIFRAALLDYWQGCCCVTGLAVPGLLRASHIKPWAKCESDDERLDVFNGLLLAPHIDALFDGGWISFSDDGRLIVSDSLPLSARRQLGVSIDWSINDLKPSHARYLQFHRNRELRRPE